MKNKVLLSMCITAFMFCLGTPFCIYAQDQSTQSESVIEESVDFPEKSEDITQQKEIEDPLEVKEDVYTGEKKKEVSGFIIKKGKK